MTTSVTDTAATPDGATLERVMREALRVGDVKGVHAALSIMATTDPIRAERLLGTLRGALAVARIVNGEATDA